MMTTYQFPWPAMAMELVGAAYEDHGSPTWPAGSHRLYDTMAASAVALRMVVEKVTAYDAVATFAELDRLTADVAARSHAGLLDRTRTAVAVKLIELADPVLRPEEIYDRSIPWALFEAGRHVQDFDVVRVVMPMIRSALQDVPDRQRVLDELIAKGNPT